MWEVERGYLINKVNWSWYVSFLIFVGLGVLVALPGTGRIEQISDMGFTEMFFSGALIIFYGIFAMNLGQAKADLQNKYKKRYKSYIKHLVSQLIFLMFITMPYWIIFKMITYANTTAAILAGAYLFIYGFALGLFGFSIGLSNKSEIFQFNLKYAAFIAYLALTLFSGQLASPFLNFSLILKGKPGLDLLPGYLILAAVSLLLVIFTWRKVHGGDSSNRSKNKRRD
jgi:MFS family permease